MANSVAMRPILFLSFGSAAGYVLATLLMKRWDAIGNIQAAFLVALALAIAVLLETEALRQARLGYVLIIILGFEASLALLCGWLLFREVYAAHELLGLLFVIAGIAIARLPPAGGVECRDEVVDAAPPAGAVSRDCGATESRIRQSTDV